MGSRPRRFAGVQETDTLWPDHQAASIPVDDVRHTDEAGDEFVRRVLVEVDWRPQLLDAPSGEDSDPIAHRQGLILVVGDVDEGDAQLALDSLELNLHLLPQFQIERTQRFIEKEHFRLVDDGPGQGDPLPLAAGQLVGVAVAEAGKSDQGESRRHPPATILARDVAHLQAVFDVRGHRHVREEGVVLEHGVGRPRVGRHRGHIFSAELDPAGIRTLETGDEAQQRSLAGPRGA